MGTRTLRARVAAGATLATLALLVVPGAAGAVECDDVSQTVTDQNGLTWLGQDEAVITAGPDVYRPGLLHVGTGAYNADGNTGCDKAMAGREFTYPELSLSTPAVLTKRRIWVADGDIPFVRFFDTFRTVGPITTTLDIGFEVNPTFPANKWRTTSDGDALVTGADGWAVLADTDAPAAPGAAGRTTYGEIWSPPGFNGLVKPSRLLNLAPNVSTTPWASGNGAHYLSYDAVTIPPGGTVSLMHIELIGKPGSEGLAELQSNVEKLALAPPKVYEGLSAAERASLLNWPADPDGDGDHVIAATDNCPTVANVDQKNTDNDAEGDACDADDDNDGVPDTVETALGGNPLIADTDGDTIPDGTDQCATLAGVAPNGCPVFAAAPPANGGGSNNPPVTPPATVDRTAPKLTLTKVPSSLKLKTFLKGVTGSAACDEACSISFEIRGSAKKVTLARFETILGTRGLALGTGTRSFSVKPSKKLVGRAKKLTVQLRATATDAAGNRTTVNKTIRVK